LHTQRFKLVQGELRALNLLPRQSHSLGLSVFRSLKGLAKLFENITNAGKTNLKCTNSKLQQNHVIYVPRDSQLVIQVATLTFHNIYKLKTVYNILNSVMYFYKVQKTKKRHFYY